MLINELAKKTGLSAHTIRYYEKYGLIKGTRNEQVKSNNYYHYNEETVYKLELIRDAKLIGFTLQEIKHLIDSWYSKRLSKQKKIAVLEEKSRSIDEKIAQLKAMKKLIASFKKEVEDSDC